MYAYAERIIRAQAEHYKSEPAIVAWQIDNEFGHEDSDICYCDQCRDAFRAYLRQKFGGDIRALNEAYGTTFWSQEYNDFDEIPLPARTITTHNPALRLDWERFRSESILKFASVPVRPASADPARGGDHPRFSRRRAHQTRGLLPGGRAPGRWRPTTTTRCGAASGSPCPPMRSPSGWTISGA